MKGFFLHKEIIGWCDVLMQRWVSHSSIFLCLLSMTTCFFFCFLEVSFFTHRTFRRIFYIKIRALVYRFHFLHRNESFCTIWYVCLSLIEEISIYFFGIFRLWFIRRNGQRWVLIIWPNKQIFRSLLFRYI